MFSQDAVIAGQKIIDGLYNSIGEIKKGTPITTDGFAKVDDIDKDGKLNLIISRDAFLYNFEIE